VVVPYYPVRDAALRRIIGLKLRKVERRLFETHRIELLTDDALVDAIAARCTEVESGARNVDNILTNSVLHEVSRLLLRGWPEGTRRARCASAWGRTGELTYELSALAGGELPSAAGTAGVPAGAGGGGRGRGRRRVVTAPTQAGRPLRVETQLGPDALLLHGFTGEEAVSRPFRFVLALSTDGVLVPDADALLGTPACVSVALPSGGERHLHGRVSRFRRRAAGAVVAGYEMELVPWLWMLSLSADCRIYQEMSVPDIVKSVFDELG
jgi:hypothetical protein